MAEGEAQKWSQRGYESTEIALRYIEYRPKPPTKLSDRIVEYLKEKYDGELNLCLDVGCGSGQCSEIFAPHFKKVLATDISSAQIEVAKLQNYPANIEFQVSPAEQCPVEDGSVQIVNSSVAAHWFDLPAFFKEVDRVLCPNGIVALSCYGPEITFTHPTKSDELFEALRYYYEEGLRGYWASGMFESAKEYANIHIPYEDRMRDAVWKDETQSLASLVNLLTSWCAYNNYCKANGEASGRKLLDELVSNIKKVLGTTQDPSEVELKFKRKYFILFGRKPA